MELNGGRSEKMPAIDFNIVLARPPAFGGGRNAAGLFNEEESGLRLARFAMQDCGRGIDSLAIYLSLMSPCHEAVA